MTHGGDCKACCVHLPRNMRRLSFLLLAAVSCDLPFVDVLPGPTPPAECSTSCIGYTPLVILPCRAQSACGIEAAVCLYAGAERTEQLAGCSAFDGETWRSCVEKCP